MKCANKRTEFWPEMMDNDAIGIVFMGDDDLKEGAHELFLLSVSTDLVRTFHSIVTEIIKNIALFPLARLILRVTTVSRQLFPLARLILRVTTVLRQPVGDILGGKR
jgi:hypothetical protein